MSYCKHLRKRKNKPYCNILKKQITLSQCQECVNKEYHIPVKRGIEKKFGQIRKSPVKHKHAHKRITVSKETYNAVIERDKYCCRLINNSPCEGWLELHHIKYRSERKDLINDINNCIMLCEKHHELVHNNKKKWQPILIKINKNAQ